ncbi:hypothetical protein Ddc_16518 [Ditylenchus destructor]|nr:hypothetical protein Ddc_16518 [Ditylenchus destructor]
MRPYLGLTVRVGWTKIYVAEDSTYNPEHIAEMESIAYLWRDGNIRTENADYCFSQICAENFQSILDSPTILQCQILEMSNAHFSFKDYKVLYTLNIIDNWYSSDDDDHNWWPEFLEHPGIKPLIVFRFLRRENIDNFLDRLSKAFSSAILPNSFKIVLTNIDIDKHRIAKPLTEFRETNNASSEKLELKKGLPVEYQKEYLRECECYTLERSSV